MQLIRKRIWPGLRLQKLFEPPLINWAVVAGVLLLSAWVGSRAYQLANFRRPPMWALALFGGPVAIVFGVLAIQRMPLALTVLVATSVVVDLPISTGTSSPINLTILTVAGLTGLWIFRMLVLDKQVRLVPSAINWPLLGFIIVAGLAWLAGYAILDWRVNLPGNALQVQAGQFAMFALAAAALLLAANHPLDEATLKWWSGIILLLGVVAISSDLLRLRPHPLPAAIGSMHMWPFVLLTAQLLFNPTLRTRKWQILGWAIVGLWAYWFLFGPWVFNTKGKWAPAVMAIGFLLALRSFKLTALLGLVGLAILVVTGYVETMIGAELATGTGYRPLVWRDVIEMTSQSWLLGLGPVNYMYYWPTLGVDSLAYQEYIGKHPSLVMELGLSMRIPSHNMWIDLLAQTGLVGLLMFLVFAVLTLRLGWRLGRQLPPSFLKAHTYGVMCGFAALLIGSFWFADWLIPFVYNITIRGFRHSVYSWLLLGTLISIEYALREKESFRGKIINEEPS